MSILSRITGIGISPKGVKIEPGKALMTALTVGSLGAGGALGGLTKLGSLSKLGKLGKVAGAVKGVGSMLGGGGEGDPSQGGRFRNLLDLGQFGEGVYDTFQKNRQYKDAKGAYDAAAPLRDAAMKGLLDTSRPDVSSVFADPNAPQGRYRRVNIGSRGY